MKVIIIYSGKGGVGKTTTTANLAKTLIAQKKKVFILDADVNTPSMPVIFPDKNPNKYLMVDSLGYKNRATIYITDSSIRAYLTDAINSINDFKPDYVLIDTPPSITDVHINLLNKIKPSGLIIVTQPNSLSISDINRTCMFFKERGVNIIGIVENMCTGGEDQKYEYAVLESIPFEPGFDNAKAYTNNRAKYLKIASYLKNSDAVVLQNQKRQLYNETISIEDVEALPCESRKDLQFINLNTWDFIRELLEGLDSHAMVGFDKMLSELTTERIGRLLKHFEHDDQAYFMITKAPNTEIPLIPGEIGKGSLTTSKACYGAPCIKYSTESGDVTLFAYEVLPVNYHELIDYVSKEGYKVTKSGRYVPPMETLIQCDNAYGSRVGFFEGWEKRYDDILNGVVKKLAPSMKHESIVDGHVKARQPRRARVIRDIANKLLYDRK